jgi:hypothetical protein
LIGLTRRSPRAPPDAVGRHMHRANIHDNSTAGDDLACKLIGFASSSGLSPPTLPPPPQNKIQ